MNDEIVKSIYDEMALSYECAGRKSPDSLLIVAGSIQDAVKFANVKQVHEIFKRARDVETIPTQRVLKECLKNYGEEFLKYSQDSDEPKSIEYTDRRSAWLPSDSLRRAVNTQTAIKHYCDAIGGEMPLRYMRTHATRTEQRNGRKCAVWENTDAVTAFDEPIKEYVLFLYNKYLRQIPFFHGFPVDGEIEIGIIPPTIDEFKTILKAENVIR